ncbi:trypsin-like cysteine/serine peptidase domain-containing protein [Kickxella alabastrina]|uniref:trypsin-like cysteine/serine peptidase domain-containing protein n=1 Tax=Kickxella alabastrina TaxID=61397 RepID=UPI0022204739|nr:trypsin-like cysteine/serine peptidase domain-containing protein [Kickxella alabastrina]KAI7829947.1 trypsin-like cysteine/serine peptidase domain-containing protein [Kickxella alabastrina]
MRTSILAFLVATVAVQVTVGLPAIRPNLHRQKRDLALREANANRLLPRVIGGVEVPDNEYSFVAFVHMNSEEYGEGGCTGTLLSPNIVITAAHCVCISDDLQYNPSEVQITFSHKSPYIDDSLVGYNVSQFIVHPDYKTSVFGVADIALLILNTTVPETVATTVKLYNGDWDLDTPFENSGFGLIDPLNYTVVTETLMKTDLKAGDPEYCKELFHEYDPATLICTEAREGKDMCYGDSGGPLMTPVDNGSDAYAQIGIASFLSANYTNPFIICGTLDSESYFTRVEPYLGWIVEASGLNMTEITASNTTSAK